MISKEQWQEVEEELKGLFPTVKFRYQEHEVRVTRERKSESQTVLAVYVDGYIRGAWMLPSREGFDPIARQLWRTRTKGVYSPKMIKEIEKIWGKRQAKKRHPDLHGKREYFDPYFVTAASIVRQYRKLDGLELLQIGYKAESEQPAEDAAACS